MMTVHRFWSLCAVHWLDAKLTRERLFEILERLAGEAQRGYNRLSV